jgi:hypothetical protein
MKKVFCATPFLVILVASVVLGASVDVSFIGDPAKKPVMNSSIEFFKGYKGKNCAFEFYWILN